MTAADAIALMRAAPACATCREAIDSRTMACETMFRCDVCAAIVLAAATIREPLRDRKGGAMAEWPEALRVREYPR